MIVRPSPRESRSLSGTHTPKPRTHRAGLSRLDKHRGVPRRLAAAQRQRGEGERSTAPTGRYDSVRSAARGRACKPARLSRPLVQRRRDRRLSAPGTSGGRINVVIPWLRDSDPFPPLDRALTEPDGLLAAGGTLRPGRLLDAYRRGIFPWSSEGQPLLWWSPDPRMVLFTVEFRSSRSLNKRLRNGGFQCELRYCVCTGHCCLCRASCPTGRHVDHR